MKFIFLFALFLSLPALADAKPTVFLIPGAASSGDRIYLHRLSWPLRIIKGDRYFGKLLKTLEKNDIPAQVCPKQRDKDTRTLEERADDCATEILKSQGGTCSARSVSLMGHSMGGLIARLLAQDPRVRDCIHSVTTVATPHRGTPIADFSIDHIDRGDRWGRVVRFLGMDYHRIRYLPQLKADRDGTDPALFHAQDMPDNPEVTYYSFSQSKRKIADWALDIMRGIIEDELKKRGLDQTEFGTKNDGVVPEYSMLHGKYLGHLDVYHTVSSCSSRPKLTDECTIIEKALIPHLKGIYRVLGEL